MASAVEGGGSGGGGSIPFSFTNSSSSSSNTMASPQEVQHEIKAFLSGMDPVHGNKLTLRDHAKCALLLLRHLPASRGAVLEHLCGVFDEYVGNYVLEMDEQPGHSMGGGMQNLGLSLNLDDVVTDAHRTIAEFVRVNPRAWAPLISAWSVELMGRLSSKYAGRHGVPHTGSLNELLQTWMGCKATRTLMDMYVQCLASLDGPSLDVCVGALLDTSVRHSPHFDWVVAHIGSSFPSTIISRVLSCGLKDFCLSGVGTQAVDPVYQDKRVAKIGSVVGILGHLAGHHADSIKQELLKLFHESLSPPDGDGRDPAGDVRLRAATVPFLLQLASLSPPLLGAVSSELMEALAPAAVLQRLQQQLTALPRDELDNMLGMAVHLVGQTGEAGAYRVLQFLVRMATPSSVISVAGSGSGGAGQDVAGATLRGGQHNVPSGVRDTCERILQLLLLNLHKMVYNRPNNRLSDTSVPFLDGLRSRVGEICEEMLRLDWKCHLWLQQLLSLLCVYGGASLATEALCHSLSLARGPEELSLVVQLYAELSCSMTGLLPAAVRLSVAQVLCSGEGYMSARRVACLLNNFACLLQWDPPDGVAERALPVPAGRLLTEAVCEHLQAVSRLLLHPDGQVAEACVAMLAVLPLPKTLGVCQLYNAISAGTAYFFILLHSKQAGAIGHCSRLLTKLSSVSSRGQKEVLAQLVRGAMHADNAVLFGGKTEASRTTDPISEDLQTRLLALNRKHGSAANYGLGPWIVFHAGVIGRGLKAPTEPSREPPSQDNTQWLLSLLIRCCSSSTVGACRPEPGCDAAQQLQQQQQHARQEHPPMPINPEAARSLAVLLVESICPDVTNSELAWPPEEHARHTVERDLKIQRRFEDNPFLFQLLWLVASGRPALCYCSVLLRGLLATLLTHWEASREPRAVDSAWALEASQALIASMGEGQLLPPVLANVHELFALITPHEVHMLLLSVWQYVQDNAPLPQKFTFQPHAGQFYRDFSRDGDVGKHLTELYSVLHKNIDTLGHLLGRFQI
ncbi:integrator complex subunit 5 [Lampetra planeri]